MSLNSTLVLDNEKDFLKEIESYGTEQRFEQVLISSKFFFDVLVASILPYPSPTLYYRVTGEDSLTVGDQTYWYMMKGVQGFMHSLSAIELGLLNKKIGETIPKYNALLTTIPWISYRNPEAVMTYLACHPEIEDFLKTAWPALVRHFESPVEIVLEVLTYPEEGDYSELVGWIQSTDDVHIGLDKLERFEDEWLEKQLSIVGNKFNFNIEFK